MSRMIAYNDEKEMKTVLSIVGKASIMVSKTPFVR